MAEFKLTMADPHAPKGTEFDIPVIGTVANGDSVQVTQEMQDAWAQTYPDIDMKKSLAQNGSLQFHGKDKLVEDAASIPAVPETPEEAVQQREGGES